MKPSSAYSIQIAMNKLMTASSPLKINYIQMKDEVQTLRSLISTMPKGINQLLHICTRYTKGKQLTH